MRQYLKRGGAFAGVAALYYIAGKLGLQLAFFHPSATPVWPPTGIALVAVLALGYEVAPAIFIGAFLVNLTTAGTVGTSLGIALGNTLEALCAAAVVKRYAGGRHALERAPDVLRFALLAAVGSTTISATVGVTTLGLGGSAYWTDFGEIWLTWWLGDMGGALIVAPALLLWTTEHVTPRPRRKVIEGIALIAGLLVACQLAFGAPLAIGGPDAPLEFACVPLIVWAAYRFGRREAAAAVLVVAALAVWGTLRGVGPFARTAPNESLLLLQAFMVVVSLTSLMLASLVAERRAAELQLQQLAQTDPLTGLGNYRLLMQTLEMEIQRYGRSGRPFALILFDLDRLKKINDKYGHMVGSRALARVANALRASCRVVDTAARFGGDEFALVLPDTTGVAALHVAERVGRYLASDTEVPAISVTAGFATYPQDGESVERLLGSADRVLYDGKGGKKTATMGFRDMPQ